MGGESPSYQLKFQCEYKIETSAILLGIRSPVLGSGLGGNHSVNMGKFKDLRAWQESLDLIEMIYSITRGNSFRNDFGLINQIQRSSVSIASNIAEGDERMTNKESIYFFNVAKGSAAEVITHLHIAHRVGYIDLNKLNELENKTERIGATLNSLIRARKKIKI